jgi:hypothetical protein
MLGKTSRGSLSKDISQDRDFGRSAPILPGPLPCVRSPLRAQPERGSRRKGFPERVKSDIVTSFAPHPADEEVEHDIVPRPQVP